jgi:hypothetical protein
MMLGGLLAAGYIFKVLWYAFAQATVSHESITAPANMEWTALLLALGTILLGFLAPSVLSLVSIGDPFHIMEVSWR